MFLVMLEGCSSFLDFSICSQRLIFLWSCYSMFLCKHLNRLYTCSMIRYLKLGPLTYEFGLRVVTMLAGFLFCHQSCICVNRVVFVSAGLFLCRQGCFYVLYLLVCWQGCYCFDRVITMLAVF